MPHTLSPSALQTLTQLSQEFQTNRFSEEVAGELAALGYATRRSTALIVTDKGVLALRDHQIRLGEPTIRHRRPKAVPWIRD